MADLASGDVTYTAQTPGKRVSGRYVNTFKLAFGDGALTYPALGIPLDKAKMGCPVYIESLKIVDASDGDGIMWKYDFEGNKLRGWFNKAQTHAHDFLVKGGTAAASTDAINIKTAIIGKEAATDATSLGSASATAGGVLSSVQAAAAGTEHGNTAPAATVIYIEVVGW